uniref:Syndecan/Neurexin domain-containing protein n=1 Tax=Monopterus albus TaxID=43700 RepID=A0A3Q3KHQ0_MONAL
DGDCFHQRIPLTRLSLVSQQVRETETWMPMKTTQMAVKTKHGDEVDLESSGDSLNNSDFGFTDNEDEDEDDDHTDLDDYDDISGSGDGEVERPVQPTVNKEVIVRNSNEIPLLGNKAETSEEHPSNVLMAHTSDDTLIAGGAVGLLFAVVLISLLIYCLKKKDEGSYDLGKKPIYKKAPTTEIYA